VYPVDFVLEKVKLEMVIAKIKMYVLYTTILFINK